MDWKLVIFQTVGGLGLFLMGMKIMSEGMQKAAGDRLRKILKVLTTNRFVGVFVGFLITAIIQSSSATSVMAIGFVNATLMTVQQAIGVELGAAVGTTVTGWIVTMDISAYAMPIIGIGVFIRFFSKSKTWQYMSEIMFGFGILFLGMSSMKDGFAPLKNSEQFISLFKSIDGHTYSSVILGVFVGTITTAVVQSSSAVVGIVIALASQGLINFDGSLAIVMGSNIGTTITGILASIGGSVNAKRAALAQTLFKTAGVILMLTVFYPFKNLVEMITPGLSSINLTVHIAMGHTLFNVINLVVFLPLVGPLAKLVNSIFPDKAKKDDDLPENFISIDYNMIETPSMAIMESEKELLVMSEYVINSMNLLRQMPVKEQDKAVEICDIILKNEDRIDKYQLYITQFLLSLSSRALTLKDANIVGSYIGLAHNLEKVADYVENISAIIDKMRRKQIDFSNNAVEIINRILDENISYFSESMEFFKSDVKTAAYTEKALTKSIRLKKMVKDAKIEHFDRIREKVCQGGAAIHFIDILNNLDAMSSENYNIAQVVSGKKY
ncbi:MAG TPA: Na/Pi cotransporter family protein [bacterium]|nr:Na/Pi cotransporter family protein [bacterium]HPV20835.1 Na/Pi cotransporter family protein [bacterium]HPY13573.1 Na/Pi cotransporter family protein [bacterium]HQB08222.1 Na/Pi cotransporter family protein [bacterium]HQM84355.1 Na/Pi cotransporter family protein [bacterium]